MDPGTLLVIMEANLRAVGMSGPMLSQLAGGLAGGLSAYNSSGITFMSNDVGIIGVGAGVGFSVIVPPSIFPAMEATFSAHGISGPMSGSTIFGVANGMIDSFLQAGIITVSPTVGLGAGVGFCVPSPGASSGIFALAFKAAGMVGPKSVDLASAVAEGLDLVLPTSTGNVAVLGPPLILPSAGIGVGKLL